MQSQESQSCKVQGVRGNFATHHNMQRRDICASASVRPLNSTSSKVFLLHRESRQRALQHIRWLGVEWDCTAFDSCIKSTDASGSHHNDTIAPIVATVIGRGAIKNACLNSGSSRVGLSVGKQGEGHRRVTQKPALLDRISRKGRDDELARTLNKGHCAWLSIQVNDLDTHLGTACSVATQASRDC
jgi:hypothetical protein